MENINGKNRGIYSKLYRLFYQSKNKKQEKKVLFSKVF